MLTSWAQVRNGSILVGLILRIEYDAMNCCSISWSQLGPITNEHDNDVDEDDGGHCDDHGIYHDHVHGY